MEPHLDLTDILLLLAGGLLGAWLNQFLKRPKLVVAGGGHSGPADGVQTLTFSIENPPGRLGFNFGPTIILGWKLHRRFSVGQSVDRLTARDCVAWLFDAQTKKSLGALVWRVDNALKGSVDIEQDGQAQLLILARMSSHPSHYFLPGLDGTGLKIPPQDAWSREDRKFVVEITERRGRKMRFKLEVHSALDGRLHYTTRYWGGKF